MKKPDDDAAKQAMLKAIADYTGPITREIAKRKTRCKLAEFSECQNVFTPEKEWGEFCCTEHRKRWHYLNRVRPWDRDAEARLPVEAEVEVNGHANGNGEAKPKITLAALGLGAPATPTTPGPFKRRKIGQEQTTR